MPGTKTPFRNQRARFHNYSPPYGDKAVFNPNAPDVGTPPRGGFASRKNGRVVGFWDMREYAALVLFEATPAILGFEERPERLKFRDGPSWLFYVPHFIVHRANGPAIIELSASGHAVTERQQAVACAAKAHYASRAIRFVEIAHTAIRGNPRAADAHAIMRYRSVNPSATDVQLAYDALSGGPATVARVEEASGVSHGRLLAMVRLGELEIVGSGPVGRGSTIARAGEGHRQ